MQRKKSVRAGLHAIAVVLTVILTLSACSGFVLTDTRYPMRTN